MKWEDAACEKIIKVSNIFLNKVIGGVVKAAKEEGRTAITAEFMDDIQNKRSKDK